MLLKIPEDLKEAVSLQKELSKKISLKDEKITFSTVGGVDIHYFDKKVKIAYVECEYPNCKILRKITSTFEFSNIFPYIPELFCFREGILIVKFLKKLDRLADILILDGHGIAHPRGLGLASYVGVILDITTLGCAKKLLCGSYDKNLLSGERGSRVEIKIGDKVVGYAVRTQYKTKEIFISPGNKISFQRTLEIALATAKYKIPEPLRLAHLFAKNY